MYCTVGSCLHTQVLPGIPQELKKNNASSTVHKNSHQGEGNGTEEQPLAV